MVTGNTYIYISHRIHVWYIYIYTNIWVYIYIYSIYFTGRSSWPNGQHMRYFFRNAHFTSFHDILFYSAVMFSFAQTFWSLMILMPWCQGIVMAKKREERRWRFGNQSRQCEDMRSCEANAVPVGSMYAIYGYIYIHIYGNIYHQYTPNISKC